MVEAALRGVDRALGPLDRVRRELFRVARPAVGRWLADREVRVAVAGGLVAVGSLAGAVLVPLWLLALGPLVLGVPHLLADLRYLVARPRLHERPVAPWVAACLALTTVLLDLRWGLAGGVVAVLAARAPLLRRLLVVAPFVALALAVSAWEGAVTVGIAHAHNLVAVGFWTLFAGLLHGSAGRASRAVPVVAFGLGAGAILGGAFDPLLAATSRLGPSLHRHLAALAPGLDEPWGVRWVVAFAFAQSVHYGLWLRVLPEEARARPGTRSWRASFRSVRADLGDPVLAVGLALCVAIAVWGLVDLAAARVGYLRLALFHGPLEFAVLGIVAAEGRGALRP